METHWLIEHPPVAGFGPIYVPAKPGHLTFNPWHAKWFDTEEQANEFMKRPGYIPFRLPWHAVSHGFED